jgi:hypothetical protein
LAWAQLVQDVLLPAAKEEVIFPYIHFGYDSMANILWRRDSCSSIMFKLIDYDSFVTVREWTGPRDESYLSKYNDANLF